jgi:hypothetical protein
MCKKEIWDNTVCVLLWRLPKEEVPFVIVNLLSLSVELRDADGMGCGLVWKQSHKSRSIDCPNLP